MLSTLVLASLLVSLKGEAELAFVARYYYPPGDKRISYHQLYVSDLDGKNRKQLTNGKQDCQLVRWVGRDGLAWTVSKAGSEELWYSPYPKLQPRLVIKGRYVSGLYPRAGLETPGKPVFFVDDVDYSLLGGKLKRLQGKGWTKYVEPELDYDDPSKNRFHPLNLDKQNNVLVTSCHPTNDGTTIEKNGEKFTFPKVAGISQVVLPTEKASQSWMLTEVPVIGGYSICYLMDWQAKTATEVATGFDLEVDFARGLCTSIDSREAYAPYGPGKFVNAKGAYLCRFGSDKPTSIVENLADASSISLRPAKLR